MDAALTEMKLLVVDEKADNIYRECKVAVNLRNVEGVTGDECDYKDRISQSYGNFYFLYKNIFNQYL